jgi:hypothetical protein
MPSSPHKVVTAKFQQYILDAVATLPGCNRDSILPMNSTRFTYNGKGKEGDATFRCLTRGVMDWPNLVLEVEYSEPFESFPYRHAMVAHQRTGKCKDGHYCPGRKKSKFPTR